jgi:hypothetical protein
MFSQIRVEKEDEKMLAFLWAERPGEEPDLYVNTRHVFGAKCSPAVANNAIQFAVNRKHPHRTVNAKKEIYMDDWLHGNISAEKAVAVTKEIEEALGESGFVLTKIISNSKWVLENFPIEKLAPKFLELLQKETEDLPTLKALGLRWNAEEDTFGFSTRMKPASPKNLAQCLSQMASIYDPLQIIGPFLMQGKLLFQGYFHSGKTWSNSLDPPQLETWMDWINQIAMVAELSIPRYHGLKFLEPIALNMFSDASKDAYGAVGVFVNSEGKRSFVAGKGRVTNKKRPPTIPRAELQALVVGVRLIESTLEQLEGYVNVVKVICWVDSSVVYYWVRNKDEVYKEFVANRLAEVFEFLDKRKELEPEVRWLRTDQNPADLISRGCGAEDMKNNLKFWTTGPDFLSQPESSWPEPPPSPQSKEEVAVQKAISMAIIPAKDRFKDYQDLASYVRDQLDVEEPSPDQLKNAEEELVKKIQHDHFRTEIRRLKKAAREQPKSKYTSLYFRTGPLQRLEVFIDDKGFLRLVTRLVNAEFLDWGERCPLILSSRHGASLLLVREFHRRVHHQGARTTYAELVKKYHLPYKTVKIEVFRCDSCKKHHPLSLDAPMAALHRSRLQPWTFVFHKTGMDYFGPFLLKGGKKAWGLLFTCFTTRAVHIEVCPDQSIPTWLNAVERFIARRGKPETISCDRAGTFVGGSKQMAKIVEDQLSEEFQEELAEEVKRRFQVKFFFIPPRTPHYGGVWERIIKEVQENLVKSTSTVANLSLDALSTYIVRAEGVINRRPLAIGDGLEVITPASILSPASEAGHGFASSESISRVMGQLRQMVDHFWRTWTNVYLRGIAVDRFPPGTPGYIELKPGDAILFKRTTDFHRLPGSSTMEAGTVRRIHRSEDGIIRRYDVEDSGGRIVEVPVKRMFIAEQDLIQHRGLAQGTVSKT